MLAYTRRLVAAGRSRASDEGVSTVEYGLLAAAITAVALLVLFAVATLVEKGFDESCESPAGGGTSVSCPR